jgi:hypothetical protein
MMKKVLLALFCVLPSLGLLSACSSDDEEELEITEGMEISRDLAWEIVKRKVLNNQLEKIDVFVYKNPIQANTIIHTESSSSDNYDQSPDYTSWFFFIDDIPFGNWSHPCRYIYVNVVGGKYEIHQNSMPPKALYNESVFTPLVKTPIEPFDPSKYH